MGIDLTPEDLMADRFDGLWPWHVDAFLAFKEVSTQWRAVAGLGGMVVIGLDYTAARNGLEMAGRDITPALWQELTAIEAGAVAAFAE